MAESYARAFFPSSQTQAQPTASISKSDPSGALIAGGGVTGGVVTVGGPFGGGSGPVGSPGDDGVPPIGKSGGMLGTMMEAGVCGGRTIVVAGGAASGNSSDDSGAASSPLSAGISIASGDGSVFSTGPTGASEMRFPQRVRATCSPSVTTVSPAGRVSLFFDQKIWLPTR